MDSTTRAVPSCRFSINTLHAAGFSQIAENDNAATLTLQWRMRKCARLRVATAPPLEKGNHPQLPATQWAACLRYNLWSQLSITTFTINQRLDSNCPTDR